MSRKIDWGSLFLSFMWFGLMIWVIVDGKPVSFVSHAIVLLVLTVINIMDFLMNSEL